MNSQTARGIQLRSRISVFMSTKKVATRKEIIKSCGKEAASQISTLVEQGVLVRSARGIYEFREVAISFKN